ncbi:hypothetical protein [Aurantibacillus circumpalustris]|uniref:hypothetical protein n=1 Tax=Aurantibacillus circumpalustris TaxID=3036359 RepID=UPI00295C14BE|nr:hypothetical protein [Aurantibacillus circumpalustris]
MKKRLTIMLTLFGTMLATAQDLGDDQIPKNKKGNEILPKAGDIGLGFNTIPVLDMILGTLNKATPFSGAGNVVQYTSNSNNQITGKYFLDAKTALRVRFGFNTLSGSMTNQVQDAVAMHAASLGTQDDINAASLIRVDDKLTFKKNNWLISIGIEKRRGYRRLQGFYGIELGVGNTGSTESVSYGNAFSDQFQVDYTSNFNTSQVATQNPTPFGRVTRALETSHRGGFRIGARGFVGVEYFIFAKISIAAEYGWGYAITTRRAATSKREVYNNGQNGPEVLIEEVEVDSKELTKGFSIDNNNGSIFSLNNTLGGNTSLYGGAGALTLLIHF